MDLPFSVPYELFPVEHRFVEVGGVPIHYIDEGTGDTLLLLHGNPSWSFLYRKMVPALRDSFRCIALDYPGYGMSGVPDGYGFTPAEHSAVLGRFVDQLALSDLTIMVQDWGGPIGLGLAGRRPDLVRALIIGNTFAWPLNGNWRIETFSWVMGGPVGMRLTRAFNFVPRFFLRRGLAHHVGPDVISLYLAPWRDPARRKAAVIAPRQLIRATAYCGKSRQACLRSPTGPPSSSGVWQISPSGISNASALSERSPTIKPSSIRTLRTSSKKTWGNE